MNNIDLLVIKNIEEGSLAAKSGLKAGDKIVSINNKIALDCIDYLFSASDERIVMKIIRNEEQLEVIISNPDILELGIDVSEIIPENIKRCHNNCVFCFMQQSPKGLRKSLYLKDDDYRLSFLQGTYITLTNLLDEDMKRIVDYRLSPLYISIHTTDPELRKSLMGNKNAGLIMERLKYLSENGILIYGQIVLCPGINDGLNLQRTLVDLFTLSPVFQAIGIVPVGLTKYRDNLPELSIYDKAKSIDLIRNIKRIIKENNFPSDFVFLADEFYLQAEKKLPGYNSYGGFELLENGIGMTRMFIDQFKKAMRHLNKLKNEDNLITIMTGEIFQPVMQELIGLLPEIWQKDIEIVSVKNLFYGGNVSVTGLLTGYDIINQKNNFNGEKILIPESIFNDEGLTLDGYNIHRIEKELNKEVKVIKIDGRELLKSIAGGNK